MPWKVDDVPDTIKVLPKAAITIWVAAANSWLSTHKADDIGAVQVGWAAVKNVYKKLNNKWIKRPKGGE